MEILRKWGESEGGSQSGEKVRRKSGESGEEVGRKWGESVEKVRRK